jgi:hypothetical protein
MRFLPLILLTTALFGLAGCNTFDRRAEKKADVFASLSPETKSRLEKKDIRLGDTFDMVYIALGNPDEQQQTTTTTGETTTWIYNRYWQEYRGEAYGGVQPRTVKDPKTGAVSTYLEPVSRPVYTERQQPVMKITFTGGKVSVVEQAKN